MNIALKPLQTLATSALALCCALACGFDVTKTPDDGIESSASASRPAANANARSAPAGCNSKSGPVDTDGDGLADVCDDDDDADGFLDADDPDPLDPNNPGNFSTPEAILADARIQAALSAVAAAGIDFPTHTETSPADRSGFYIDDDAVGKSVLTGNGDDVGRSLVGAESWRSQPDPLIQDTVYVNFTGGMPVAFGTSRGSLVRGDGEGTSIYSRSSSVCTESDSSYREFSISVTSTRLDATGAPKDVVSLGVTIGVDGTLTSACANRALANTAIEGGWSLVQRPLPRKVAASALSYMCVDGGTAYIPTETWQRGSQNCECTDQYAVRCSAQ
jgi:hypothetical protein